MFADLEILETQYGTRLTEIISNTNKTTQEEFKQNLTNLLGENNKFLNTLINQFQLASKELDNFLSNQYGKTEGNRLIEAYGRSQIQNLINIFWKKKLLKQFPILVIVPLLHLQMKYFYLGILVV